MGAQIAGTRLVLPLCHVDRARALAGEQMVAPTIPPAPRRREEVIRPGTISLVAHGSRGGQEAYHLSH